MQPSSFPSQQHKQFTQKQLLKLRQATNNISVAKSAVVRRGLGVNEEIIWKPARKKIFATRPLRRSPVHKTCPMGKAGQGQALVQLYFQLSPLLCSIQPHGLTANENNPGSEDQRETQTSNIKFCRDDKIILSFKEVKSHITERTMQMPLTTGRAQEEQWSQKQGEGWSTSHLEHTPGICLLSGNQTMQQVSCTKYFTNSH